VRYLIVVLASTLASCGGIGSLTTAIHPTEEHCADFQPCATSPESLKGDLTASLPSQTKPTEQPSSPPPAQQASVQPAGQPTQAEPSQPQRPPAEPPALQQQSRTSVPIEREALIEYENTEMAVEYAHYVRASGYRCDSVSALAEHLTSVTLACNQSSLRYAISWDGEGRLTVEIK
jgi:hypothetical protein